MCKLSGSLSCSLLPYLESDIKNGRTLIGNAVAECHVHSFCFTRDLSDILAVENKACISCLMPWCCK